MAVTAQYAATPRCGATQVSTANTKRDGTGILDPILTAGASGTRIDAINIKAMGTTTAGMIRLFVHDGTVARLLTEIPVTAVTPSDTLSIVTGKQIGRAHV